jgi:hypothetical protein
VVLGVVLGVAWAPPAAHGAFVAKSEARAFVREVVPPDAPRVMLRDERAGFFRTERLWVQSAPRCRRRAAAAVSCRVVVRMVPDAPHRRSNWWRISCRGSVLVRRGDDGRLTATQRDYVCRTIRP